MKSVSLLFILQGVTQAGTASASPGENNNTDEAGNIEEKDDTAPEDVKPDIDELDC